MMRLSEFRDSLRQELGDELYDLIGDKPFERWINVGQRLLGVYVKKTAAVTWVAGDTEVALPVDWHHGDRFQVADGSTALPAGQDWGQFYVFERPATQGGSGTFYYYGSKPKITGAAASTCTEDQDEALISYALYRFFKRLASSRSDYRMYATITQSNGVDVAELDDLSERHKLDFDAVAAQPEPLRATTFYTD